VTQASGDLRRAPLIERIVELKLGEAATVLAPKLGEVCSLAFCLELMAQTAALVSPHHRLVRLRHGNFQTLPDPSAAPITVKARRVGAELEFKLETPHVPVAAALLEMADTPRDAPTMPLAEEWTLDRRGRSANGASLYSASELARASGRTRIVQWASQRGLGQLVGGLGSRGPQLGVQSPVTPMASSPGVVEGLTHLTEWQWYALAGEGGQVHSVDRIEWYRIPRPDEPLVATIACRGSVAGSPSFDAIAFGADHKPALEIHGLRLLTSRLANDRLVPRVEWQSFIRLLDAQEHPAPQ